LEPDAIQNCFIKWVKDIAKQSQADVIAIDGKTARRSLTTKERKNALHIVSAWSYSHGMVLGQQKVEGKSNQITANPILLYLFDIEGACITADAMSCQKDIAAKVIAKKAEYVFALKGNQGGLNECWTGIQTLIQIDYERHIQGETTNETRYNISSLGLDAQRANQVVRNHLVDVLQRVSQHPAKDVIDLTPRRWKVLFADKRLRSEVERVKTP
jgi:predicted transposase YbfD/YdcC